MNMKKVSPDNMGQDRTGNRLTLADFAPPYYSNLQKGQQVIITDMARWILNVKQDLNRIMVLQAPCGVGKSTLVDTLAGAFAGGKIGSMLILTDENTRLAGDISHVVKRYPDAVVNLSTVEQHTPDELQALMDRLPSVRVVALSVQRYNMMSQRTRELLWKFYDENGKETDRDRILIDEELLDVEPISMNLSELWNWANQYQQRIPGDIGIQATRLARKLVSEIEKEIRRLPGIPLTEQTEKVIKTEQATAEMQESDALPDEYSRLDTDGRDRIRAIVFNGIRHRQEDYDNNCIYMEQLMQEAQKFFPDSTVPDKDGWVQLPVIDLNAEDWVGEIERAEQKIREMPVSPLQRKIRTISDIVKMSTRKPEKWLEETKKMVKKLIKRGLPQQLADNITGCADEMLEDLEFIQIIPILDKVERNYNTEIMNNAGNYTGIRYEVFRSVFTGQTIIQHSGDGKQKKNRDSLMRVHTIINQIEKLPIGRIKIFVLDGTANISAVYANSELYDVIKYNKPHIPGTLVLANEYSSKSSICNMNNGKKGKQLAQKIQDVIAIDGIKVNPEETMLSTYKNLQADFNAAGISGYSVATHGSITGTNKYRTCETLVKIGGLLMPMFSGLLAAIGRNPELWKRLTEMSESDQIAELNKILTYTATTDNSTFYRDAKSIVLNNAMVRTVQEISRLRMRGWPSAETPAEELSYRIVWVARYRKNYDPARATLTEELVHRIAELLGLRVVWHNSVLDPWNPPVAERALEWIQTQVTGTEYTRSSLAQVLGVSGDALKKAIVRNPQLDSVLREQRVDGSGRVLKYRTRT